MPLRAQGPWRAVTPPFGLSTVAIGTDYEKSSVSMLQRHGFVLTLRGGGGDEGVDFDGWWKIPKTAVARGSKAAVTSSLNDVGNTGSDEYGSRDQWLAVMGQCKRLTTPCGVAAVRELIGVTAPPPLPPSDHSAFVEQCLPPLRMLLTTDRFTEGCYRDAQRSELPIMLLVVTPLISAGQSSRQLCAVHHDTGIVVSTTEHTATEAERGTGTILSSVWLNTAAAALLPGVSIAVRRQRLLKPSLAGMTLYDDVGSDDGVDSGGAREIVGGVVWEAKLVRTVSFYFR